MSNDPLNSNLNSSVRIPMMLMVMMKMFIVTSIAIISSRKQQLGVTRGDQPRAAHSVQAPGCERTSDHLGFHEFLLRGLRGLCALLQQGSMRVVVAIRKHSEFGAEGFGFGTCRVQDLRVSWGPGPCSVRLTHTNVSGACSKDTLDPLPKFSSKRYTTN